MPADGLVKRMSAEFQLQADRTGTMEIGRLIRALLVSAACCSALATPALAGGLGGLGDGGGHGPGGLGGSRGGLTGGLSAPGTRDLGKTPADVVPDLSSPTAPTADTALPPLEQDKALAAVRSSAALPLDQIVASARHLTQGQIVDAQLTNSSGPLLYRLTVLEATGEVRAFYFYAQTGQLMRVE
jgi:hypothetical protein